MVAAEESVGLGTGKSAPIGFTKSFLRGLLLGLACGEC